MYSNYEKCVCTKFLMAVVSMAKVSMANLPTITTALPGRGWGHVSSEIKCSEINSAAI